MIQVPRQRGEDDESAANDRGPDFKDVVPPPLLGGEV